MPRTAVDLAVPFCPRISTPPMEGSMALHTRAFFIFSWPRIAEKEKIGRVIAQAFLSPGCVAAAAAIALLSSLAHEFKMLAW